MDTQSISPQTPPPMRGRRCSAAAAAAASNTAHAGLLLLGDELLSSIASWLPVRELGRLAKACTRFGGTSWSERTQCSMTKRVHSSGPRTDRHASVLRHSVIEEAARAAIARLPPGEVEAVLHRRDWARPGGPHGRK